MRALTFAVALTLLALPLVQAQQEPAPDTGTEPPRDAEHAPFWTYAQTLSYAVSTSVALEAQPTPAVDADHGHIAVAPPPTRAAGTLTATVHLYDEAGDLLGTHPLSVEDAGDGGALGVAAWGDCVLLGLSGSEPGSGRAVILHYTGQPGRPFEVIAEFTAPQDAVDFGRAVAFDDMGALIGAQGKVYRYGAEADGYPLQETLLGGPGFGSDLDMGENGFIVGDPDANTIQIHDRNGKVLHTYSDPFVQRLGTDVAFQDQGPDAVAIASAQQHVEGEKRSTVAVFALRQGAWSDAGTMHVDATEVPPSIALVDGHAVQPTALPARLSTSQAPMPSGDHMPPPVFKDTVDQGAPTIRFGYDAAGMPGLLAVSDGADRVHLFRCGQTEGMHTHDPRMGCGAPPLCFECLVPPDIEPPFDLPTLPREALPEPPTDGPAVQPRAPDVPPEIPGPDVPPVDKVPDGPEEMPFVEIDPPAIHVELPVTPREPTSVRPSADVEITYTVDEPVTIVEDIDVSPSPPPGLPDVPGEEKIPDATQYVDIHVEEVRREDGAEGPVDQAVTIKVSYDEAELPSDVAEEELALHFFDGTDWVDLRQVGAGGTVRTTTPEGDLKVHDAGVDTQTNTVWARVDHTSTYALGWSAAPAAPSAVSEAPWLLIALLGAVAGGVWLANGIIAARNRPVEETRFVVEAPAVAVPVEQEWTE